MPRVKYKKRPDGRKETTKVYKDFGEAHYSGRKHFYGQTDDEIDRKIAEFEKSLSVAPVRPQRLFKYFADKWWASKEAEISPNSRGNYYCAVKRAKEQFDDTPVKEIRPLDCVNYLKRYTDLSQKTLGNTKTILKEILDLALLEGEIEINPCISLPPIKANPHTKKPRMPAADEDVKFITEDIKTGSMQAKFFFFLMYTGLRRSEALALKGKDFDMDQKVVHVRRQIYFKYGEPAEKDVKTTAGERTVELPDIVVENLPDITDSDSYIWFPEGMPRSKVVYNWIHNYMKENNLTSTPHQYRHSYATMLHSAGVDVKDAQNLLGHSTVAMTQNVYTHIEKQHKKEVQNRINAYIQGDASKGDDI